LGYNYPKEGGLIVDPEEAQVVQRTFQLYAHQKYRISKIDGLFNLERAPSKTEVNWTAVLIVSTLKTRLLE
jgi:hypothetical protein